MYGDACNGCWRDGCSDGYCRRTYIYHDATNMESELNWKIPDWVSAKDVILELLRRHDVKGGVGKVIEYTGPGLDELSAMDRHVIANMGAELGATGTVFPSDEEVKRFLKTQGRGKDWIELKAD